MLVGAGFASRIQNVGGTTLTLVANWALTPGTPNAVYVRPDLKGALVVQPHQTCQVKLVPPNDVSATCTVRATWLTTGVPHVPLENAVPATEIAVYPAGSVILTFW